METRPRPTTRAISKTPLPVVYCGKFGELLRLSKAGARALGFAGLVPVSVVSIVERLDIGEVSARRLARTVPNTIAIPRVSGLSAAVTVVPCERITPGCRSTNSLEKTDARLTLPPLQRISNRKLGPSAQPNAASSFEAERRRGFEVEHRLGARSRPCNLERLSLQVDSLVAPGCIELGTPNLVRALVLGPTDGQRRPQSHVEIIARHRRTSNFSS